MALETKALGVISLVNTDTEKRRPFIVVFVNLKHDKHLCNHLKCRAKARVFTSIGKSIASQSRLAHPCFFSWKRRRSAHHYAKKKKATGDHYWANSLSTRAMKSLCFLFDNSRKSLKKSLHTMLYFLASIQSFVYGVWIYIANHSFTERASSNCINPEMMIN
jgi:hypothetical protein